MSLVKSPLFSLSANKTLGKEIIFVKSKNRNIVKKFFSPSNPNSPDQKITRDLWLQISEAWKFENYTKEDIEAWNFMAKKLNPKANGRNMLFKNYGQWDRISDLALIFDVFVPPPHLPNTITCQTTSIFDPVLRVIRGPDAGLTIVGFAIGMMLYDFRTEIRNPKSLFTISSNDPSVCAYSGLYPLDEEWWI